MTKKRIKDIVEKIAIGLIIAAVVFVIAIAIIGKQPTDIYFADVTEAVLRQNAVLLSESDLSPSPVTVEYESGFKGTFYAYALSDEFGPVRDMVYATLEDGQTYVRGCRRHYVFSDEDIEVAVLEARHNNFAKVLGYGWLNSDGNLMEKYLGKEEAKGLPNYSDFFSLVIRKGDRMFYVEGYCNTSSFDRFITTAVTAFRIN